jgi:YD repeat-containing protein
MTTGGDTDAPRLSDAELSDWQSLVSLVLMLPAAIDSQLKSDAGMNGFEYHVLARLADAPQLALPMSDLAAATQSSPSRLSHAVDRLERAGWVERFACTEAGRRTSARLTDAGTGKLHDTVPGHVRQVRRLVVDVLTPQQLAALGEASRQILAASRSARPVPGSDGC